MTTPHRKGALALGLNLTKLESRLLPQRSWEYLFNVDIEGSLALEAAAIAIAELRRECADLRVLGSHPARTTVDGAVHRCRESSP